MFLDTRTVLIAVSAFVVFVVAAMFLMIVLVAYFERRLIWPYGEIDDGDPDAPAATAYHDRQAMDAEQLDLVWAGSYRDLKGRPYRVRYEFWLTPERDVLAMVGVGTVAGIPTETIWLDTPLADGRVVVSTNSLSGMESMPGDPWEWALLRDATLPKLIEWHRDRVAGMLTGIDPFDTNPTRAVKSMARRRADRVSGFVARGMARYRNADETAWSFSVIGGLRLFVRQFIQGISDR